MEDKLKKTLATILNLPVEKINENSSPANIPEWDSLKQMQIMLAVEDEFGIQFSDDEIHQLSDYLSIRKALEVSLSK